MELDAPVAPTKQPETIEANNSNAGFKDGLTAGEQAYTAVVFLCAGLFLVPIGALHFLVIPKSEDPGAIYFSVAMLWTLVLVLTVTAILNLYYRSLLIIPTILQCVALTVTVWLIPAAFWGGKLLYRRSQQAASVE